MARSKSIFSSFRKAILYIAIAAVLLILLVPRLISTKRFYEPFIHSMAKDKLHLEVDGVQLRWLFPIEIRGIRVSDLQAPSEEAALPPEAPLLTIKSIRTDRGLLSYLLGGGQLGRIEIIEPKVDISLIEDGSNLQRLVDSLRRSAVDAAPTSPAQPQSHPAIDLEVAVFGASVQVGKEGDESRTVVVPPFDLRAEYHGIGAEPNLLVHPSKILDQVELNQELIRLGLGKAIPLLAKSAWFDGRVSLETEAIKVPILDPLQSVGKTRISLHQVRTGPAEPLLIDAIEFLSNLRGKEPDLELVFVDGSVIEVGLENERVFHSGLEAGFPKIDERLQLSSSGSVGLADKSLDLTLLVPVPLEQLALRDSVKKLGVPRLRVPVRGTLEHPAVEWAAMREDSGLVLAMMASQMKEDAPAVSNIIDSIGGVAKGDADEALKAAADLVQSLREARQKSKASRESSQEGRERDSEDSGPSRRPVLDALRRAVRGE